ncbi:hypothetical protein RHP47_05685 [Thermosynechococcus sp. QKsg1]|uniref:hypothetical protein n=1 Tax=unclassified Thermosynechococcus TaxID=2622553 RepID=UPI0025788DF7|nr:MULTISPECIES: hypothetical protein [unclassified Thermosynechococcus]WJI25173.1 hypothetical protein MZ909_05690 [Thermosynechococcus sp. B0]WJI30234.1 hypothetical protein M0646_05760 [Thermosynechococcus sp. B3]WNC87817.1 hypothetical protein RHP47_05685 [Thermosynechococcus sp. QKsg1]
MRIGELLLKAGLITRGQLQVALMEKSIYTNLRFGEIVALHGWLPQETIDFFVEEWPKLSQGKEKHPIGFYLKKASLLTEEQIQQILKEQWQTSYRFGALAVLNGWVKQETVNFFLQSINPNALKERTRIEKATLSDIKRPTPQSRKPSKQSLASLKKVADPEDLAEIDLDLDFDLNEIEWLT